MMDFWIYVIWAATLSWGIGGWLMYIMTRRIVFDILGREFVNECDCEKE
jgi:hypothetical protein